VSASLTKLYAVQLLRGLAHAHERGVVHRDMKPSNVVVDTRVQLLQIIDWGLSGILGKGNRELCSLHLSLHSDTSSHENCVAHVHKMTGA
jgi:serine/threonine protein kinase